MGPIWWHTANTPPPKREKLVIQDWNHDCPIRSWIKVRFSIWQWVIIYLILEGIEPGPPWRNRLARCTYRHKEMRRLWVRASPGAYVFRMIHLRLCQTTCGLHLHRFWLAERAQPRTNSLKIIFIKRKAYCIF